jgi:uncharacterized protein (TIGR03083 family)
MQSIPDVDAVPIFMDERRALIEVLESLRGTDWSRDTSCPGWSVKDIVAHILADDLGRLSGGRDGYRGWRFEATGNASPEQELLSFINAQNEAWVASTRRLSPQVLIDLLAWSGRETQTYFESLDPAATAGIAVSWAGEDKSANWFDLARELTERWHHQQQIRAAAGIPELYAPRIFVPVLDTFVRAVPHTYRDTSAAEGTVLRLTMPGATDGQLCYDLVRTDATWRLVLPEGHEPDAEVRVPADTAWRVFTRGIPKEEAIRLSSLDGDQKLAAKMFDTVSIIA